MTAPDPLHVPEGRGHPYGHGDEERVPLLPIAGEPVRHFQTLSRLQAVLSLLEQEKPESQEYDTYFY